MTREEAIIYLKRADTTVGQATKTETAEALDMAIKALKQESVLDKIRDEIADLTDDDPEEDYSYGYNYGLMKAAQIIDKHRTESEVENADSD